jgi:Putative metal-binding motif
MGQVLPKFEICANNVDEDCNGTADDAGDADGDGWPMCNGDCCDSVSQGCSNPRLVNPGAYEVVGNGLDDDCNPATSDMTPPAACSATSKFTGVNGVDVANAMEICQYTIQNPTLAQRKWGLITAYQLLANGNTPSASELASIKDRQSAILTNYGTGGIVPRKGATMAGLSSGYMRDLNDPNVPLFPDTNNLSISTPPAAYLAAKGGALPASAGCSGSCPAGTGAYDSTNIRLTIRTPTNALSFSYQFKFISYEYWVYSCTLYNDFYLALLQSGAQGIPADKNISFDGFNNPVSVNNGFFDVCVAKGCYTCPAGYGELAGTGMDAGNYGGATKWLTTEAPIVPGENIQLEFILFDVSDGALDSVTLLDNFQWGLATTTVNTHE